MTKRRHFVWDEVGLEIQTTLWREKLEATAGNITHAGEEMGFSRRHAFRVTADLGLSEYARTLRRTATGKDKGRPPRRDLFGHHRGNQNGDE